MKLTIDTSDKDEVVIMLGDKEFRNASRVRTSQVLLLFIKEKLSSEGKRLDDIAEISVNTGPGSFTGLRVGMSVANALAWSLDIPVNGSKVDKHTKVEINY